MVHNIKYLVSYYKANNLSAKGQATQQKKKVVRHCYQTTLISLERDWQEVFLGTRNPKNRSLLGVNEDFEDERNAKRPLFGAFKLLHLLEFNILRLLLCTTLLLACAWVLLCTTLRLLCLLCCIQIL